jgi:hypothetical protein
MQEKVLNGLEKHMAWYRNVAQTSQLSDEKRAKYNEIVQLINNDVQHVVNFPAIAETVTELKGAYFPNFKQPQRAPMLPDEQEASMGERREAPRAEHFCGQQ